MAKSKKEVIEITEEGIIINDGLVADYRYLYDKIKTKSCTIIMKSKADYLRLLVPFRWWLQKNFSEDEVIEIVAYIKNEWEDCLEIINMFER